MTDRLPSYTAAGVVRIALQKMRIRHKITRPYRRQTNGKAERFIQTLLAKWEYARLYRSNQERLSTFPKWLAHYNHRRFHTALGGSAPVAAAVNNVSGKHNQCPLVAVTARALAFLAGMIPPLMVSLPFGVVVRVARCAAFSVSVATATTGAAATGTTTTLAATPTT